MTTQKETTQIALMAQQLNYIVESVDELKSSYVSKQEFDPIKRIVYGGVGAILIAVIAAILGLVINKS